MITATHQKDRRETSARNLAVWSATPTPLQRGRHISVEGVRRMIDHHIQLGMEGVMLAGTCGEGPWLSQKETEKLVKTAVEHAAGRLRIAVQVTDNSPALILERLETLASWGGKMGVLAQPYFFMNGTASRLRDFYLEVWERSPMAVALYDRGRNASVPIPLEVLTEVAGHPRVELIKDSAGDEARFDALREARRENPNLRIFSGGEFDLMDMLHAGYDGAFFGGAVATGKAVRRSMDLFQTGDIDAARSADKKTKQALYDIYGGPKITCWLAGLKYYLCRLGVFEGWSNIPGYPLTDACRTAVDRLIANDEWRDLAGLP